jgi:hypothetical protein
MRTIRILTALAFWSFGIGLASGFAVSSGIEPAARIAGLQASALALFSAACLVIMTVVILAHRADERLNRPAKDVLSLPAERRDALQSGRPRPNGQAG